ncbi:hypothetical protein N7448_002194 [Penicillium atrosanguineum]|uniref:uncharacterized protein n=1 Tax=Penicillium atrosanguineum TaxID=1132637 RepID=UPI002386B22C|nr:uncharacterized protein N7443_005597 [Penicillium atrosanguineum]KAJ5128474.1 hypothetical protein N7526_006640 [Penicillium atrosanguineum]KAJ5144802.1 hypothetical protein N7448_002194 [Penicillium atrosanguineum]KAJ5300595.1 hypothetical protein N7443_005597 [Penicillium atrosanguineum]
MAASKIEADVILNRANVALARSQRLVSSWLPAQTDDELSHVKSEEELQREEDEIFTAVPETLGVGAPLPEKAADGSWNRTELSSNDKLRKQLLGRNYDKIMKAAAANKATTQNAGPLSAKTRSVTPAKEESDDEEEGRAAMVGKKRKAAPSHTKKASVVDNEATDKLGGDEPVPTMEVPSKAPSKGRKKATSYLDELLAERSKKRKKR